MACSITTTRWQEEDDVLNRQADGFRIAHPSKIPSSDWIDDMKLWPAFEYKDLFNYLVMSVGIDGEAMANYKSMDSYNYFHADKVGALLYNAPTDELCLLKAAVKGSHSENTKHKPWVLVTSSGVVETAGCSCTAGRGKSYSHVGGILWKLEYANVTGRTGTACTDNQQKWNQDTMKNMGPQRLENISFKRKRSSSKYGEDAEEETVVRKTLREQPAYRTKGECFTDVENSSVADLLKVRGSLLARCYSAEPEAAQSREQTVHGEHSADGEICTLCKKFYSNYVHLKRNDILQNDTQSQADSVVWHDARRVRITASSAKKVPLRVTTNTDNFLQEHLYPSFRGNWATRYGKESEPKAFQALQDMGIHCSPRGTVVSVEEPWLSASPDGVTDDGKLVEVKCPIIQDDETVKQFRDRFSKRFYDVVMHDGEAVLERSGPRGYYMQVQLTMFCTGLRKCIFFVWSRKGHLLVVAEFDEEYVHNQVFKLKQFYFLSMLPRLVDDYSDGRLKVCKQYKAVMSKSK